MDRLSPVFARFSPSAEVFYSGTLCGVSAFDEAEGSGHLHLVRGGRVTVHGSPAGPLVVDRPAAVFFPRPRRHRLETEATGGADLVCASIRFGGSGASPLVRWLPEVLVVPLDEVETLAPALTLLFAEAFGEACGRRVAVNTLMEYVLVLLLRHAMEAHRLGPGVLAGLADARLAAALTAMHERPEDPWTLDTLAREAGMSRARFAHRFRAIVGDTPLDYLGAWRVALAQALLKQGTPLKLVAPAVGYASAAALSRTFTKRIGVSPTAWRRADLAGEPRV